MNKICPFDGYSWYFTMSTSGPCSGCGTCKIVWKRNDCNSVAELYCAILCRVVVLFCFVFMDRHDFCSRYSFVASHAFINIVYFKTALWKRKAFSQTFCRSFDLILYYFIYTLWCDYWCDGMASKSRQKMTKTVFQHKWTGMYAFILSFKIKIALAHLFRVCGISQKW